MYKRVLQIVYLFNWELSQICIAPDMLNKQHYHLV